MRIKMNPYLSGVIYATIFGFSFMATKLTLDYVTSPFQLLAFRFSFAALTMSLLIIMGIVKVDFRGKNIKGALLVAFFQPIVYFILETYGINALPSSQAGIMIAFIPILVTILAHFILGEHTSIRQWGFILMSIAGVLVINIDKLGGLGSLRGTLLLLGAVIAAAFYNIASRKMSQSFTPIELTYVMMWIGAICFSGIGLVEWMIKGNYNFFEPFTSKSAIFGLIYLGVISSVLAFLLVNYTLSKIEASRGSLFANLTTVVSIIAGVVILNEQILITHIIGCVLILLGVYGTNKIRTD